MRAFLVVNCQSALVWLALRSCCDLDVAPAFERSKHHEEIGGAIALILIIETSRASRFHRDRHARFGNELLRGLVEAKQPTSAAAWPRPPAVIFGKPATPIRSAPWHAAHCVS